MKIEEVRRRFAAFSGEERGQYFLKLSKQKSSIFLYLLLSFLIFFSAPYSLSAKKQKADKPKQEKMTTLYKNAKTAVKNINDKNLNDKNQYNKVQNDLNAARDALLGAVNRPELSNKKKAKIFYTAALLEESLNSVENRKAYLKQQYDTAKFFNKLRDMYEKLRLCDSVDVLPDAKGNVSPRYQKRTNAQRLQHRRNIIGGGKFFLAKKDYASAYPFLDLYCSYKGKEKVDTLYPQAVLWATLSAFQVENYAGTVKHVDNAIHHTDSATAAILQEYKVRSYAQLRDDTLWLASLKEGVINYPYHDWFFVQLSDWCYRHRRFDVERQLADRMIAQTGGKAIHFYAKSKSYLSEEKYDDCIACADSCIAIDPNFADAWYNKGIAYLNMAVISQETCPKDVNHPDYFAAKLRIQEFYRQARPCMEMVRKLQPELTDRWASPLYRIYLNLNLGEEFNEIDKLLNQK